MTEVKKMFLKGLMRLSLEFVDLVWRLAARWGHRDSQTTLDWLDALNIISVGG